MDSQSRNDVLPAAHRCDSDSSRDEEIKAWIMKYAVVIEQGSTNFGAYVPDLPGCIATAITRDEVVGLIREAIGFHIEGLRLQGIAVPKPGSAVEFVDVVP